MTECDCCGDEIPACMPRKMWGSASYCDICWEKILGLTPNEEGIDLRNIDYGEP